MNNPPVREPAQNRPDAAAGPASPSATVSRRTIAAGLAWSVPVVVAAAPAHAAAASCLQCADGPLAHYTIPGSYTLEIDECVTQVSVEVAGGAGGESANVGGNGALLTTVLTLPAGGTTLTLVVGDRGQHRGEVFDPEKGGGYARGGYGGIRAGKVDGAGGGGSSALLVAGQPLLIAGGGGGGGNATSTGAGLGDSGEGGNGWGIQGQRGTTYGVAFPGGLGGSGVYGSTGGPQSTAPFPVFGEEVKNFNTGRGGAGGDAGDGRGGDGYNASIDPVTWSVGASGGGGGGGYAGGAGGDAAYYTEDEVYLPSTRVPAGGGGAGGGGGTNFVADAPIGGVVMAPATLKSAVNGRTVAARPGWVKVTCL